AALTPVINELGKAKGIRTVPPENLHLTLDFLGEIREAEIGLLCEKLKAAAEKTSSFSLTVSGVGAFRKGGKPNVLWIGIEKNAALAKLAYDVKAASGTEDGKKFSPHLTVGRIKFSDEKQRDILERFFRWEPRDFGTMKADHFSLMKSDLSGKTPVYTVIRKFILKDGEKNG
ncbi:MAG: RNA 2',3'-cyclic phosphodiesterase, partial [Clostridia bacterium]